MKEKIYEVNGIKLDKWQFAAANTKSKNALVLAGAGCGKTFVIVARIKYLTECCNVDPKDILCISFTNDAVNKLKEDLNIKEINVMTFHKLALKIIGNKKEILSEDILTDIIIDTFSNDKLFGLYKLNKEQMYFLVHTFINLFKCNGYSLDKFYDFIKRAEVKEKELLKEIMKCYICYESYLNKENLIDFNDMISLAIKSLENTTFKYKYVIVDEYQDTSITKLILLKKIIKLSDASFFAVGDDFQSIYGFTGSDINIITKFKKYFFNSKIYKLKITYRNANELIRLAGNFIMKNPYQIRKRLCSFKKDRHPLQIVYYEDLNNKINQVIKEDKIDDLFILSRNNCDLDNVNIFSNLRLRKLTIHKSKGLQADCVFVIGLSDNANGFPNKYQSHEILRFVNKHKVKYPYDEERRLFYVALTRCKKKVYLFVRREDESIFVKEIKRYKSVIIREK